MRHQHLVNFFAERSKYSTLLTFFCKISLTALKLMYLGTYGIFFNLLSYRHSVTGNNRYLERTGTISSLVITLYSSYTDPYLLAEFSQIGWIQLVLLSIRFISVKFLK